MFTAKDQARLAQLLKRKQESNGEEVQSKKVDRNGDKVDRNGDKVDRNGDKVDRNGAKHREDRSGSESGNEAKSQSDDVNVGRKQVKRSLIPVSLETKSMNLTEVARNRLAFSRFRSINEYLYSNPSRMWSVTWMKIPSNHTTQLIQFSPPSGQSSQSILSLNGWTNCIQA